LDGSHPERSEGAHARRFPPAVDLRRLLSALAALSALSAFSALSAQTTTAAGRVVLAHRADSIPLPRARVVLHQVGRQAQGPIDSLVTDAGGRFRFRFTADSGALYLLSSRYGGIEYFSPPVHTNPARPDTAIRLVVYDTSSTAPVAVEARHIVVPRPNADGSRSILDLIVLRNAGIVARVAPDSAHPSWRLVLPPGTGEMEVGESDVSPDAILRAGDTVKVVAPIAPGLKQLSIEYAVAPTRGRIQFPMGTDSGPVNLLVEERDARVSGAALALADSEVIEGRSFRRWTGRVPAGGSVVLTVAGGSRVASRRVLDALVAAVALALALAAWRTLRRRPAREAGESRDRLFDAIAALDARYAGREPELAPDEWRAYQAERARLKAALESALASASANG
jgi:hypothetical protein